MGSFPLSPDADQARPAPPAGSNARAIRRTSAGPRESSTLVWALSVPALLLFAIPVAALVARTPLSRAAELLADRETTQALALSLWTSTLALAITVTIGTPLACALAQSRARWVAIVDSLVDLPTVLPPAVAGIALLMAFGRQGWLGPSLGAFSINIAFTPAAVVIAQVFVSAPYFIRSARAALLAVDPDTLACATLDGCSRAQRFLLVTLPLAAPGFIAGAALCWARALGEFGATMIFAGNFPGRTQTMPLAIYLGLEISLDRALLLSALLLGVSLLILVTVRLLRRP